MSQSAAVPAPDECHRHTVTISVVKEQIRVEPELFAISKNNQEEVIWEASDPNLEFTVEFEKGDSPFHDSQFNKYFSASGLVRRSVLADPQRTYKYTVRVEGVRNALDPTGVVTR
jgi:hypothetical protein